MPGAEKRIATYKRRVDSLNTPETVNRRQMLLLLNQPVRPPRHNDIIPIQIKGHAIKGHMAYFIGDQDFNKGKDPNIHIIDSIHNIKGRIYVNVLISNYSNKHITFNKGEYVGHLESPVEDMQQIKEDAGSLTTYSITMESMMAKKFEPETFKPPHHKL